MGGRQNGLGMKFIYATEAKEHYHQHSDNLELVTILECANAVGNIMPPYFVLKEGLSPNLQDGIFDGMGG
jgi:hypothetical protein